MFEIHVQVIDTRNNITLDSPSDWSSKLCASGFEINGAVLDMNEKNLEWKKKKTDSSIIDNERDVAWECVAS
jgi:hypothetical protein